jgi:hypothetical protein
VIYEVTVIALGVAIGIVIAKVFLDTIAEVMEQYQWVFQVAFGLATIALVFFAYWGGWVRSFIDWISS